MTSCTTINAQWIQQASGTNVPLNRIKFVNRNTGWICGDTGTILKTTNGGSNWFAQSSGVPNKILTCISPVNDSVVYCVGWFQTVLKTIDGGNNWMILENGQFGQGNSYHSCFFLNEQIGWIGTTLPGTLRTVDGGKSFVQQPFFDTPKDIYFKDGLNGLYSGGGTVGKTTNGGNNWNITIIETPGIGLEIFKRLSVINNLTGYIVGDRGTTYKTTNFGISWDSVGFITDVQEFMYCSKFINDSLGYAGGNFTRLFKTTNGGKSWVRQAMNNGSPYDIFCFSDSVVWLCGKPGIIWNTITGGQTSISQTSQSTPEIFRLSQNYPNPFNPSTKINYELQITNYVTLSVYDINGRLVKDLVNQKQSAGNYSINFDGSGLPSGTYIYCLQAGDFSETRKMVLLK